MYNYSYKTDNKYTSSKDKLLNCFGNRIQENYDYNRLTQSNPKQKVYKMAACGSYEKVLLVSGFHLQLVLNLSNNNICFHLN